MTGTLERLLEAAEDRIRTSGFHAVSFRDLAADLGIKSASVHYHFPRKEDLGVAVVTRYATRVFDALEAETTKTATGVERLAALVTVYRAALLKDDKTCLCGVMGAESLGLPEPVRIAVQDFLEANIAWVADAMRDLSLDRPEARAAAVIASLQGAMMLSVNLRDMEVFDRVADQVLASLTV